jgi:myo-inositol-1(or 4)-monophosphatase
MTTDPGSLLPVAFRAVTTASETIRTHPLSTLTEKSDRDLVSDVDLAVERAVRAHLETETPAIGFLGEEEGRTGTPGAEWTWTLDPIDGTSNFAHGIPLCAVSLALLHHGHPVLGVIEAPFLGERYHAIEGQGAYLGTRRLAASNVTELRDAIVAIGDYAVGKDADRENQLRLAATLQLVPRVHRIRMLGTAALDLAWVAAGRLDASITLGNKPWDTAAGVIIAREAGAVVTDKDGSPHDFNSAATIAASSPLISQLIPLLQAIDSDHHPMNAPEPLAALDEVITGVPHLILHFEGPLWDPLPGTRRADLALALRTAIADKPGIPPAAQGATDPLDLLAYAADLPDAYAHAETLVTDKEASAVPAATAAAYLHEAAIACRESGRTFTIISRHGTAAIRSYLEREYLESQVTEVIDRDRGPQPIPELLKRAFTALEASPTECTLITASADAIRDATSAGANTIGYTRAPGDRERLTAAGANTTIGSLADLTLRLRARALRGQDLPLASNNQWLNVIGCNRSANDDTDTRKAK